MGSRDRLQTGFHRRSGLNERSGRCWTLNLSTLETSLTFESAGFGRGEAQKGVFCTPKHSHSSSPGHQHGDCQQRDESRTVAPRQLGRDLAPDGASGGPGQGCQAQIVPTHLGVDEMSAGRGQEYVTVVSDADRGTEDEDLMP
jgi:hypothetical protein